MNKNVIAKICAVNFLHFFILHHLLLGVLSSILCFSINVEIKEIEVQFFYFLLFFNLLSQKRGELRQVDNFANRTNQLDYMQNPKVIPSET